MCSASLSPKRNSFVIGFNLSPNAPAYSAVYLSLLHANETGNWNAHPYTERHRKCSPKLTSPKSSSTIWNPLVYSVPQAPRMGGNWIWVVNSLQLFIHRIHYPYLLCFPRNTNSSNRHQIWPTYFQTENITSLLEQTTENLKAFIDWLSEKK